MPALIYAQLGIVKTYNQQDGLPGNLITNIYQDKYGYLWIATTGGNSRYDGGNLLTIAFLMDYQLWMVENFTMIVLTECGWQLLQALYGFQITDLLVILTMVKGKIYMFSIL